MSKMKPSDRPFEEIQKQASEDFFRHNGYHPQSNRLFKW